MKWSEVQEEEQKTEGIRIGIKIPILKIKRWWVVRWIKELIGGITE